MTKSVEFFYDYSSPFSYFADCQLPAIAQRRGAQILYRPAILGVLIVESGNQPPPTVPAKLKYMTADMRRWATKLNVPFVMNPAFPVRSITLMRAALIAQDTGVFARFHPAMWRAMWVDGANLGDAAVLTDVLNRAGPRRRRDRQSHAGRNREGAAQGELRRSAGARCIWSADVFRRQRDVLRQRSRGIRRRRARAGVTALRTTSATLRPSVRHCDVVVASRSKSGRGRASCGSAANACSSAMRGAQQRVIAVHRPDHLNAERRSGFVEAARQRDHRMTHDRNRRRQREPRHVVRDRLAVDLARIEVRPLERRNADARADHQVVVVVDRVERLIQLHLRPPRSGDGFHRRRRAPLRTSRARSG